MKHLILFILVFLFSAAIPISQAASDGADDADIDPLPELIRITHFQEDAARGIDSLYNSKPDAAREVIGEWIERYPDHPVWLLWDAMEQWWVVLNDLHDTSNDDLLFEKFEKADKAAEQLLEIYPEHADGHIVRAVANGYIARHNANRRRWVRSVRVGRTAHQAHTRLAEVLPELADNKLAEGLKLYYSAYLPENYRSVRAVSWLLPDGDREKGLELLEETSRDAIFARPEASYFLGFILLNYENDQEKALTLFRTLSERYPDNAYYRRLLARTLFELRLYRELIVEVDSSLEYWEQNGLSNGDVLKEELHYWKGKSLMRSGRLSEAHEHLVESYRIGRELPNRPERTFQALSGFYAGLTAERLGDISAARNFYRGVTQLDNEPEIRREARNRLDAL